MKKSNVLKKNVLLTKEGYDIYYGFEVGLKHSKKVKVYRSEKDLIQLLSLLDDLPIVENHPADGKDIIFNDKYPILGIVKYPRYIKGKGIEADLMLFKDSKFKEVSLGYSVNMIKIEDKYHFTDMKPNHLAILAYGRCGKICKIKDSKGEQMAKIVINDAQHEVSDVVAGYISSLEARDNQSEAREKEAFKRGEKAYQLKANLKSKATQYGVSIADKDTVKDIQIKILTKAGVNVENATEDFLLGAIAVLDSAKAEPVSITTPSTQTFDYSSLTFSTFGGE